ncbi:hypothetical protein KR009_011804, partial [Drosophila setifemur]
CKGKTTSLIILNQLRTFSPQEKPLTDDELDSCIDKYGINKQDLLDMDTGKLNHANAKDNEKCAILCIHQMLNIVDSSGKLMKDHIKAQFDRLDLRAPSEQILDDCSNMEGTNACDTAFLSVECLLDSSGEDLAA